MKFLKKLLKAFVKIVFISTIIIVVIVILFEFVLSPKKTPITARDFSEMMASQDYSVVETSGDFEEQDVSIEKCVEAQNSDGKMVFYELTSEEDAEILYDLYKEEIKSLSGAGSSGPSSGSNYEIYERSITGESFYCISRIENTLLYVEGDTDARKDVYNLLEKMGYVEVKNVNFSYGFDKTAYYD